MLATQTAAIKLEATTNYNKQEFRSWLIMDLLNQWDSSIFVSDDVTTTTTAAVVQMRFKFVQPTHVERLPRAGKMWWVTFCSFSWWRTEPKTWTFRALKFSIKVEFDAMKQSRKFKLRSFQRDLLSSYQAPHDREKQEFLEALSAINSATCHSFKKIKCDIFAQG